jgi:hypothetical protein
MAYKDLDKARAHAAAYRAANREKLRLKQAAYHAAHREERCVYNAAHRDERRAYNAAHREEMRGKSAAYYAANRDKKRTYNAAWGVANRSGRYPTEAKVEKYLVDCVELLGGMCPKFNDPGRRGAPDRIVCLPGHPAYFVELKRPKIGKLDAHQVRYHEALRKAGQRVWVIWSKEEVDGFFAQI